jgi:hypothetical protein
VSHFRKAVATAGIRRRTHALHRPTGQQSGSVALEGRVKFVKPSQPSFVTKAMCD